MGNVSNHRKNLACQNLNFTVWKRQQKCCKEKDEAITAGEEYLLLFCTASYWSPWHSTRLCMCPWTIHIKEKSPMLILKAPYQKCEEGETEMQALREGEHSWCRGWKGNSKIIEIKPFFHCGLLAVPLGKNEGILRDARTLLWQETRDGGEEHCRV